MMFMFYIESRCSDLSEIMIIKRFKIPAEWICEALALKYNSFVFCEDPMASIHKTNVLKAVKYFILAGDFHSASNIVVEELAANWIFSGELNNRNTDKLVELLKTIQEGVESQQCDIGNQPHPANVHFEQYDLDWFSQSSAWIILEYYKIKAAHSQMSTKIDKPARRDLESRSTYLLSLLDKFSIRPRYTENVSSLIDAVVHDITTTLLSVLSDV